MEPMALEPVPRNEKPEQCNESSPNLPQLEKSPHNKKDPAQPKIINKLKKKKKPWGEGMGPTSKEQWLHGRRRG